MWLALPAAPVNSGGTVDYIMHTRQNQVPCYSSVVHIITQQLAARSTLHRHDLMLVLPKAVLVRIFRAGTLSVGLRLAVSPSTTRPFNRFPREATGCTRNMSSSPVEGSGTSGTCGKEEVRERKKTLRKRVKSELKAMSEAAVDAASAAVAERLLACPQLQQGSTAVEGGGGAVSVYLSMPGELGTADIVSGLFKRGKKVYIPKVCRKRRVQFHEKHDIGLRRRAPCGDRGC